MDTDNKDQTLFQTVNHEMVLDPAQSPEKLFEKYNALAKEALSSGDKILSENYLQHADHFDENY